MNMTRIATAFKAVACAVAAACIAAIGTSTPAQAATYYSFKTGGSHGYCLLDDAGTDVIAGDICGSADSDLAWKWGAEENTWNGHTMRRLVSLDSGDCLTTDDLNVAAVYTAPCGSHSGQFWTNDNQKLQNQNGNWLYYGDVTENKFGRTVYSGDEALGSPPRRATG
jgi:hypothetical protein